MSHCSRYSALVGLAGSVLLLSRPARGEASNQAPLSIGFVQIVPKFELGFTAVLDHKYQAGINGTHFNYLKQGGEDTLYLYQRYAVDVIFAGQHYVTFLYQPFTLNSVTVANRNNTNEGKPIVIDGASFPPGTPMNLVYGFDFWRVSYLYDFLKNPKDIVGIGLSLQLRNASIDFTSANGNIRSIDQNIGPVPILKFRAAHWFNPHIGIDFEADGFYASSAIFNGSSKAFTGWIWDAAISIKTRMTRFADLLPELSPVIMRLPAVG